MLRQQGSEITEQSELNSQHGRRRHYAPSLCLEPHRVVLFPGAVKLVDAAANSSAALRADDGMLFTWGCGEAGRLGHHEKYTSAIQHAHTPCAVSGLCGRLVASMTITEHGGFAFVPSSVSTVEPPLVPIAGGTQIVLRGGGFWDSADCVVKFIPAEQENSEAQTLPRSSVGKYVTSELSSSKSGVICKLPRFTTPCDVFAEVAMNGKDFTSDRVRVRLYEDPVLVSIKPICCSSTNAADLTIIGSMFFETGIIKVRFKERGGSSREWIVPGALAQKADSLAADGELSQVVKCKSPIIDGGDFPVEVRVAVALNGADFVALQNLVFVIHNAAVLHLRPNCRPLDLNPQDETPENSTALPNVVTIIGQSFFDSSEMIINLKFEYAGDMIEYSSQANYVDTKTVTFAPPSLYELLGFSRSKKSLSAVSDDDMVEEQDTPVLPEQPVWIFSLELSLNGTEFLRTSLPFMLYRQLGQNQIIARTPMCGPSIGGTRVSLRFPSWFCCCGDLSWPQLNSAIVQLRSPNGSLYSTGPIIAYSQRQSVVSAKTEPGDNTHKESGDYVEVSAAYIIPQSELLVTFSTPAIELDAIMNCSSSESTGDLAGKPDLDDKCLSSMIDSTASTELEPDSTSQVGAEKTSIKSRRVDMIVEVALDGQNFSAPCDSYFTCYGTPCVTHIKTTHETAEDMPVATSGTEVSMFGTGFFDDGVVKVHIACLTVQGEQQEVCISDAYCTEGVVKFTMPDLKLEKGSNFEQFYTTDENQHKLIVDISFNGGENFTSSGIFLNFFSPLKLGTSK